ncbi:MAG: RluA family pseudouridine synthase [Oscillospiraceae bacterium]|jgi:23S rRNA pseudouridine955/2504/2580 synthase
MRELIVGQNDAGQRLDRFLGKAVPLLPSSLLQKAIRTKKIKLNGSRADRAARLNEGDVVSIYLGDDFFKPVSDGESWRHITKPELTIVYEDDNILLLDKKPGVVVHSDGEGTRNTLIANILAYLHLNGGWEPEAENAFTPALCNRIDRNTGGIVIAAKNAEALRIMNEKIRSREVRKFYLCLVHGKMEPPDGVLRSFIWKDAKLNRVYVTSKPQPGARTAVTRYRTLSAGGGLSLLECELETGRTHQIRAQMAHSGHPLVGDGKYGAPGAKGEFGRRYQALYSYKILFDWQTGAGMLDYLKGREFKADNADFSLPL